MRGLLVFVLAMTPTVAAAHPLSFGALHVRDEGDRVAMTFRYSGSEGRPSVASPRVPPRCAPIAPPVSEAAGAEVTMRVWLRCEGGLRGAAFGVSGLEGEQVMVRIEGPDGVTAGLVAADGDEVALSPAPSGAVSGYLGLGVEHILFGWDHLLFLLGVLLLLDGWRPRLTATVAFTVGHGITLALATLGLVRLPAGPVEAVIALSIVLVALELARDRRWTRRHAALVAGGFGLLHGLGFAGALAEVGVPEGAIAPALLGFNLGVELGQLLVVAAFALVVRLTGEATPRARLTLAYAVGPLACALVLARTTAFAL